jgi:hypothetical protein
MTGRRRTLQLFGLRVQLGGAHASRGCATTATATPARWLLNAGCGRLGAECDGTEVLSGHFSAAEAQQTAGVSKCCAAVGVEPALTSAWVCAAVSAGCSVAAAAPWPSACLEDLFLGTATGPGAQRPAIACSQRWIVCGVFGGVHVKCVCVWCAVCMWRASVLCPQWHPWPLPGQAGGVHQNRTTLPLKLGARVHEHAAPALRRCPSLSGPSLSV